jgi:phosphate-selective porin
MTMKAAVILAMTAACLATIAGGPVHAEPAQRTITVKHPPVVNPGDISASWSGRQNAVESKQL